MILNGLCGVVRYPNIGGVMIYLKVKGTKRLGTALKHRRQPITASKVPGGVRQVQLPITQTKMELYHEA